MEHIFDKDANVFKDKFFYLDLAIGVVCFQSLKQFIGSSVDAYYDSQMINETQTLQTLSPKQLLQEIQKQRPEFMQLFQQQDENSSDLRGRFILEGITKADQAIWVEHAQQQIPLLYQIQYQENMYSLEKYQKEAQIYRIQNLPQNTEINKLHSFQLISKDDGVSQASVYDFSEADIDSVLQFVGSKETKNQLTFGEHILVFLLMILRPLMDVLNLTLKNPKGMLIGVRENEIGIKLNSNLLIQGQVIYNFSKNELRIQAPDALFTDKNIFIQKVQQSFEENQLKRAIFGTLFLGTAVYFGRQIYLKFQKLKLEAAQKLNQEQKLEASNEDNNSTPNVN